MEKVEGGLWRSGWGRVDGGGGATDLVKGRPVCRCSAADT